MRLLQRKYWHHMVQRSNWANVDNILESIAICRNLKSKYTVIYRIYIHPMHIIGSHVLSCLANLWSHRQTRTFNDINIAFRMVSDTFSPVIFCWWFFIFSHVHMFLQMRRWIKEPRYISSSWRCPGFTIPLCSHCVCLGIPSLDQARPRFRCVASLTGSNIKKGL